MHEMSIVTGILNIVEDQALAAGAKVINSIEMEIGEMAGVEIDSLEFCFEVARKGGMAAEAELIIHEISAVGHCSECKKDVPVSYPVAICATCGQAVFEVTQGKELRVKSINVD